MGAGASYGAKNAFGDFPSGSKLAESLYDACNITPDDKNDLQDAAQTFEETHSAAELIREIRTRLTCASFAPYHSTIYSQPWRRYYTTNYDDVALLAARAKGVNIFPVTLSSDFNRFYKRDRLCIHINGYLGNLDETTLHTEFKLTAVSYLSNDYINNSQWGALLTDDLDAAKCIDLFDLYGAWGKNASMSNEEKRKFLKSKNHGSSQFQSIMVDVLKSDDMVQRIKRLVDTIQSESKMYHKAVIIILITQVMNLRISAKDIEKVTGQSIITDAKFRANPAIQELLDFRDGKQSFVIKSSVTSNLIQ